jgi:hypothetical protein
MAKWVFFFQIKALPKIIITLLLIGFAALLGFYCWIHVSYSSNLPNAPDVKAGRVYRMVVNHGFVCYGSERELRTLRWAENSQPFALVFALMAVIIGVRYGHIQFGSVHPSKPK